MGWGAESDGIHEAQSCIDSDVALLTSDRDLIAISELSELRVV